MLKKIIFTVFILGISISANAQWWGGKTVKGNENVVTVKRTTSDYDGISVGGSFDVIMIKGKEGNITIEGEENIIPLIETEVNRNTLEIKVEKNTNIKTTRKLTVTVTYTDVDKISLGGSGTIKNEGILKTNDLKVNLGGSGDIELIVESDEVKSNIGGS